MTMGREYAPRIGTHHAESLLFIYTLTTVMYMFYRNIFCVVYAISPRRRRHRHRHHLTINKFVVHRAHSHTHTGHLSNNIVTNWKHFLMLHIQYIYFIYTYINEAVYKTSAAP